MMLGTAESGGGSLQVAVPAADAKNAGCSTQTPGPNQPEGAAKAQSSQPAGGNMSSSAAGADSRSHRPSWTVQCPCMLHVMSRD